jgi:hypothetical protein
LHKQIDVWKFDSQTGAFRYQQFITGVWGDGSEAILRANSSMGWVIAAPAFALAW